MRIALTITELDPGGAERCLVNLAKFLNEMGHTVSVFAIGNPPAHGRQQLVDQLDEANIPWKTAGLTRAHQFPSAVKWLRKQLREFAPDVVQSMLFHANFVSAWALPESATAFFGGVRVRQPERIRWKLQRLSARRMTKLICVSKEVLKHCRDEERIPREKLTVIPNGIAIPDVETPLPNWKTLGLSEDAKVVLSVGRLAAQKGYLPFLESADSWLPSYPKHHFVIFGEGLQREALELRRLRLACRNQVHLLGWRPDAMHWMRASELVLLPSHYEGMPNVILECMAQAKPFVSFPIEGIAELTAGMPEAKHQIADSIQMQDLLDRLTTMLDNPELRKRCGAANQARVVDAFLLENQLRRYEDLYKAACHAEKP